MQSIQTKTSVDACTRAEVSENGTKIHESPESTTPEIDKPKHAHNSNGGGEFIALQLQPPAGGLQYHPHAATGINHPTNPTNVS